MGSDGGNPMPNRALPLSFNSVASLALTAYTVSHFCDALVFMMR
jgi:hypothetical protein